MTDARYLNDFELKYLNLIVNKWCSQFQEKQINKGANLIWSILGEAIANKDLSILSNSKWFKKQKATIFGRADRHIKECQGKRIIIYNHFEENKAKILQIRAEQKTKAND